MTARFADVIGDRALVRTRDEAIAAGWFGPVEDRVRRRIGDVIEARQGPTRLSRGLQTVRRWLQNRATGALARPDADPTSVRDPGTPTR